VVAAVVCFLEMVLLLQEVGIQLVEVMELMAEETAVLLLYQLVGPARHPVAVALVVTQVMVVTHTMHPTHLIPDPEVVEVVVITVTPPQARVLVEVE
jgi:hypothetical protein